MAETIEELLQKNEALQARLDAAEEALRAITSGEVDALVIYREEGEQVYTLEGADHTYRVMVEKIQEGVATLQPDGMLLYANKRLAEMLNVPLETLLGASLLPYIPLHEQAVYSGLLRKARDVASKWEVVLHPKDGSPLPVMLSMTWVEYQGQQTICLIATDLSEQKRQEEILASERLARSILEQAAEVIVVCDTAGNIIRASQATYEIVPDNPLFQPFDQVFPLILDGDAHQEAFFPTAATLRGQTYRNIEVRWAVENRASSVQSLPTYFLLSASPLKNECGEILGAIISLTDISERKQSEAVLRMSETRFHQLADAMPQLVWTARPDGFIDYINQRYQEYAGLVLTDDRTWDVADAVHPDDLPFIRDGWLRALETGEMYVAEIRMLKTDGSFRWHLDRAVPIRDEAGQIVKWFGTATDIQDLKHAHTDLEELSQKLQRSNQELERFAFVASHDLQEPLRKIRMFGDSLQRQLGENLPEDAGDSLARIHNAAVRMEAMINSLLELSRINTRGGNFQITPLSQIVEDVLSDLETRIQKSQGKVIVDDLPTVEVDPLQFRLLFQNLLTNALKFHQKDVPPEVHVSASILRMRNIPQVILTVADNGIGFDEKYAEEIFKPFKRLHGRDEYEGTGIGLAICQRIVERHNGTIKANSRPGEGTVFQIILPVHRS